jgi:predicted nuclease of predicted toxin-antitoxin system
MKFPLDMNLTPGWVQYLKTAGIEALHWSNVGRANAPDEEAYAARAGLVVLTHDLDFSAILAATKGQIRAQNISPEAIGTQVVAALRRCRIGDGRAADHRSGPNANPPASASTDPMN